MNIGINARLFIKGKMEGVARYIYENTRRMVANHPEHTFVFFFDRSYDESFIFSKNVIPVIVFPSARHPILWHIWWQWQIPRLLKKHKIDVFYTGEIFMPRNTKVPCAIVSHDLAYLHYPDQIPSNVRSYYARTYPLNHKKADAIIAVSNFTKQDIVRAYGIDKRKIDVIYNAVPEGFTPLNHEEKEEIQNAYTKGLPYFAYLGSFHPRKNIVNLILGYNEFKKSNNTPHKLVLMGRWGWNTEEIKQKLAESPYIEDIIMINDIGDEKFKIVAASEALCYVSLFEGFGIPILEGFSAGVPVITSNVSSMSEVAGDSAYLVDPKDPMAIAQAMTLFSENPEISVEYIKRGNQRVLDFDWTVSAKQTFSILERISSK